MTRIGISYFNYEHGGLPVAGRGGAVEGYGHSGIAAAGYHGGGYGYDYAGLVRVMADGTPWPDIFIMGEGDRYEFNGQEGAREAARAMRRAGGRTYEPLFGSLPREGAFAPVIFIDPQTIEVRRWYDHRAPDFAPRNRNVLIASAPGRADADIFRIATGHGDIYDGDARLADAKRLRLYAEPTIPCLVAMDWNSVPSGPVWEDRELNDPVLWPPDKDWARGARILWEHGPAQAGPYRPDTRALDYLIGYWHDGRRIGGIGFHDAAELAGDGTPTQIPAADGRQRRTIDRILVNVAWKDRIIPGSYRVHQPADPEHPDSDHLRVSVAVDV